MADINNQKIASLIPQFFPEEYHSILLTNGSILLYNLTKTTDCCLLLLVALFGKNEPNCDYYDNYTSKPIFKVAKVVEQRIVSNINNNIITMNIMKYL